MNLLHKQSDGEVLSKMQIFKSRRITQPYLGDEQTGRFTIDFDVYKPGSSFKKSAPGNPDFRISVCSYDDPPPAPSQIQLLIVASHPVPLKFGVTSRGDVSFVAFMDK